MRTLFSLSALCFLGTLASAQAPAVALDGPVPHFSLDYATGTLTRVDDPTYVPDPRQEASVVTYQNDCLTAQFQDVTGGLEWIDFGVKSGGQSTVVGSFTIAYGTSTLDVSMGGPGPTLDVAFYEGTTGGPVGLGTEIVRISLSGAALPGSLTGALEPKMLTVSLFGTGGFCLADGPIGYGFCSSDPTGSMLLRRVGIPCNSTGTLDGVSRYACPAPSNAFLLTGPMPGPANTSSFFMVIDEDDGSTLASTALNNGAGGNPILATDGGTPPIIGATWPLSADPLSGGYTFSAGFFGIGAAFPPGTLVLSGGQEIIADIVTFGPPNEVVQSPPGSDLYPIDIVCDVGLIGLPVTFQAILFGGTTPFALTNGVEGVMGF